MTVYSAILRRSRDDGGSVAVEAAIVGLAAIVLCIATVEIGRALYLANELAFAADQGARLVLLNPQVSDAEVEAEVLANLWLASNGDLDIRISEVSIGAATMRRLSITLPLSLLVPTFRRDRFRVGVERQVQTP